MLREVLFTHTDLDGAGCAILFEYFFQIFGYKPDVDYKIIHISNAINEEIPAFINGYTDNPKLQHLADLRKEVDRDTLINFTDILCNENNLNKIREFCPEIMVLDHHKTNTWYNNIIIDNRRVPGCRGLVASETTYPDKPPRVESATSLVYNYLTGLLDRNYKGLSEFANLVRIYDNFQTTEDDWEQAQMLNKLFIQIGMENFRNKYLAYFKDLKDAGENSLIDDIITTEEGGDTLYDFKGSKPIIDPEIKSFMDMVQDLESKRIDDIVNDKSERVFKFEYSHVDYSSNTKCIVFNLIPSVNMSALAVEYLKNHPEYQVFIWFNMNSGMMSFRSISDNVDVSAIAKKLGGGGHVKAAGSPIPRSFAKLMYDEFAKFIEG